MSSLLDTTVQHVLAWAGAALTVWMVSHALHHVLGWVSQKYKGHNHLIAIIEVVLLLVLSVIVLHEYLHPKVSHNETPHSFVDGPSFIVLQMVVFAIASLWIYQRSQPPKKDD